MIFTGHAFELPASEHPWKIGIWVGTIIVINKDHPPYILKVIDDMTISLFPLDPSMRGQPLPRSDK